MFTGIIESTGKIESISKEQENTIIWISSPISDELKIDQSVSHNGACLTVDLVKPGHHRVTAVSETLVKTNLGQWRVADEVNLERSMQMNGRLDGHIVQVHVYTIAECLSVDEKGGSWLYRFKFPYAFASLVIEKGSICVNGISLTLFDITNDAFSVAIIPYTFHHTNMRHVRSNQVVNLEFDMIGKYINRIQNLSKPS